MLLLEDLKYELMCFWMREEERASEIGGGVWPAESVQLRRDP